MKNSQENMKEGYGTGLIHEKIEGYNVVVDGRGATMSATVPERIEHEYGYSPEVIYTNPSKLISCESNILPSLSLVRFAKVKNFIDGVYAEVEKEVSNGFHDYSRKDFLKNLEKKLNGEAKNYVTVSRLLGHQNVKRDKSLNYGFSIAQDDPSIMLPQAFYDWNESLNGVYRQIKSLGRVPSYFMGKEGENDYDEIIMKEIKKVIRADPDLSVVYERLLDLYSKMTNVHRTENCLFPSARLPDQEFFIQLSYETQSDLPEGLGKLLVKAVKEGRVDFMPSEKNGYGLYVRQMNEITPLIIRDNKEFEKFIPNKKYEEILENEFISQWAGTRHTHVGHSSFHDMMIGCSMGFDYNRNLKISPKLDIEPFATCYERMESSLSFLEDVVSGVFGERVLDKKRLMQDGERSSKTIGEEFSELRSMLRGLASISKDSIHLPYKTNKKTEDDIKTAKGWIDNLKNDPDLNRNVAIFVPIIRTTDGQSQVSYINAGYKTVEVEVRYNQYPDVKISPQDRCVEFESVKYSIPIIVHKELRIPVRSLINDRILREQLPSSFRENELDRIVESLEKGESYIPDEKRKKTKSSVHYDLDIFEDFARSHGSEWNKIKDVEVW